ncbi:MAG: GxxExxY protein [Prevotella sp.]|nr:GxxExxY protein [Prevotella sp.]
MDVEELIETIKDCAREVRHFFTPGFEENVYKNAMFFEMKSRGLDVKTEVPIKVMYKGKEVGNYRADMMVGDDVIIELKAISTLTVLHEVQLVNYLTATGIDHGLLINFGSDKIQIQRKYRDYAQLLLKRQNL